MAGPRAKEKRRQAAERQSRRRKRIDDGRIRVTFEVDETNHVELLIATEFLSEEKREDRNAISDATARFCEWFGNLDLSRVTTLISKT